LVAIIVFAQGCAYYNTFYNTKNLYKEALDEQKRRTGDKPSSTEIQKYDKTIEKASKLLQFHPNSKYVDDALMILGECFYYKQEYLKAQRKFQELITIFPKSGLVPRAQLWLAKTNIELDDYAGAERVLKELQQREKKGEFFHQAQYFLGEIYFRQKRVLDAAEAFEAAVRKLGDKKMRAEAYMRLGECCVVLQQFDLAAGAFRRASSTFKNDVNFSFQARLKQTSALKNYGRFDEALALLNVMLGEFSTHRDLPLVKLEIAECTLLQGKIEPAIKLYAAIIENHQRTEASAAAYFALGEIYERHLGDFNRAKESFDNVRRESARSEKATEAGDRSKAIGELIKIKENIATLQNQLKTRKGGEADSLRSPVASGKPQPGSARRPIGRIPDRKSRRAASAQARTGETPSPAAPSNHSAAAQHRNSEVFSDESSRKVGAELARNKILLAELYLFHFDRPDSAMREYLDVFEFFPETEYAPQAMYSLAYLLSKSPATLAMRDSVMQALIEKYGNTAQGRAAKRQLGRADTVDTTQQSSNLFRQAEDYLLTKREPQTALRLYREFWQRQPDSKLAAQSLYAVGWIYEHELSDNQQALATYKKLIETYPDSPFAQRLRPRVTGVDQKKTAPAEAPPQVKTETQTPPVPVDDDVPPSRNKNVQPEKKPIDDEIDKPVKKTDEEEDEDEPEPPPF
jgi:TolA-binding protein